MGKHLPNIIIYKSQGILTYETENKRFFKNNSCKNHIYGE